MTDKSALRPMPVLDKLLEILRQEGLLSEKEKAMMLERAADYDSRITECPDLEFTYTERFAEEVMSLVRRQSLSPKRKLELGAKVLSQVWKVLG